MKIGMDLRVLESSLSVSVAGATRTANSGPSFAQVLASTYVGGETGYDSYFEAAAEAYQVPVNLLKAVGKAESAFTADIVSPCGAQGIMQLMPSTARALGVNNAFDPAQNIMGGAKYLRQMLDQFDGDVSLALAAYNAGPGAVKKYGGIPPYRETQNYVNKVLGYAGSDITATAPSVSRGVVQPLSQTTVPSFELENTSDDFLTGEDLAGIVQQVFQSGGTVSQESVRLLLDRMLDKAYQDEEEEDRLGVRTVL